MYYTSKKNNVLCIFVNVYIHSCASAKMQTKEEHTIMSKWLWKCACSIYSRCGCTHFNTTCTHTHTHIYIYIYIYIYSFFFILHIYIYIYIHSSSFYIYIFFLFYLKLIATRKQLIIAKMQLSFWLLYIKLFLAVFWHCLHSSTQQKFILYMTVYNKGDMFSL